MVRNHLQLTREVSGAFDLNTGMLRYLAIQFLERQVSLSEVQMLKPENFSCSSSSLNSASPYLSWGAGGPYTPDECQAYFLLGMPGNTMGHLLCSCSCSLFPYSSCDYINGWVRRQGMGGGAEKVNLGSFCPSNTTPDLTSQTVYHYQIRKNKIPPLLNKSLVSRQVEIWIVSKGFYACKVSSCQQSCN